MVYKNLKKHDGIKVKNYVSAILKNIEDGVNNAKFELTTDDGKTLNHKSINKVKFNVKRKNE